MTLAQRPQPTTRRTTRRKRLPPPPPAAPDTIPDSRLRVAVWTAVSSRPQAEPDKSSLDDQETAGRQFAATLHAHVVAVYTVPGHTRDLIFWHDAEASMPAYRQLRQDCQAHAFDVLWALDPDRLGRDPALSNQVISLVEKSGAEVYFASAPHQVGQRSTAQRYVYAIQSVRAAEDQALRTGRLQGGIRARVRRGLPANHWPLGYRPIPGPTGSAASAELDPDLAPAVRLATDKFLKGESYTAIVHALNASPYRPPRVRRWSYSTVRKMMSTDFYAGFPHYDAAAQQRITPDQPSLHYPPIWDQDTHVAVIRERARRRRDRYNKSHGSPLAGTVFCARCGHQMSRHTVRGQYHWLRCSKHVHQSHTGEPCHPNHIKESDVVAALTAYLVTLATPEVLDTALSTTDDTAALRAEVDDVTRRLADLDNRRVSLALALAAGQMDIQVYRAADDLLVTDLDTARARLLDLDRQIAAAPDPEQRRAAIIALAAAFPALAAQAPPAQVRTLLQNAGLRIEVDAGAITSIRLV